MEYLYNFNGNKLTLNEFKDKIIYDYIHTNKLKKELKSIYQVSEVTLGKVLKGVKKEYCECLKCGEKNYNAFYKNTKAICKTCISNYNTMKYINLSENKKNDLLIKQKKWQNNNLIRVRILAAKHRAIRKKIPFDIDEEFINELLIKQNFKCKYSNLELELEFGNDDNRVSPNTISIDRVNSDLGYVKNNVVLVSAIVNTMKNEFSEEEFLNTVNLICENSKKKFSPPSK